MTSQRPSRMPPLAAAATSTPSQDSAPPVASAGGSAGARRPALVGSAPGGEGCSPDPGRAASPACVASGAGIPSELAGELAEAVSACSRRWGGAERSAPSRSLPVAARLGDKMSPVPRGHRKTCCLWLAAAGAGVGASAPWVRWRRRRSRPRFPAPMGRPVRARGASGDNTADARASTAAVRPRPSAPAEGELPPAGRPRGTLARSTRWPTPAAATSTVFA